MIWFVFAAAAGLATWAAAAMQSGALDRARGRPMMLGAGVTAAALLALIVYDHLEERRMMGEIMGATTGMMNKVNAGIDERGAERRADRARFDRDFKTRQDAFDRSFKEQADRFDRAFNERRAGHGAPMSVGTTNTGEVQ